MLTLAGTAAHALRPATDMTNALDGVVVDIVVAIVVWPLVVLACRAALGRLHDQNLSAALLNAAAACALLAALCTPMQVLTAAIIRVAPNHWGLPIDALLREPISWRRWSAEAIEYYVRLLCCAVAVLAFACYRRQAADHDVIRRAEARAMRERLRAIRTQINPHFLRNALNSLIGLRDLSGASARQLIADLADLLRRTTVAADREEHTLREECAYLEEYCKIQRLRYPESLHTRVTIDPSCDCAIVPTLILLPLVENAVTHGLRRTAAATVEIVGSAEGYSLTLVVRNSCPAAIAANSEGRQGSGLQLVRERLSLLYGRAAVLATDRPTPTQFEATVIVPLRTSGPQQGARRGTPCES
jgi:hypothetical protein